ncbi:MAG: hypothetical protein QXN15_06820 [Candidatus Jordarchaeales archaeon]|nr:hypothetical protein [Candidatus Jordarchaeia archaeon]
MRRLVTLFSLKCETVLDLTFEELDDDHSHAAGVKQHRLRDRRRAKKETITILENRVFTTQS